jgi:hypothetical protein
MKNRTLWNLLEEELDFNPLNECGYLNYDPSMDHCTVLLCGADTMDIAGAMGDPHDTFFIVALNDPIKELPHVPKNFDAWIDAKKLSTLPTLLTAYEALIGRKEQQRFTRNSLQSFMVNSNVHKSNLEAVKSVIRSSSLEIETIFESRVSDLKTMEQSVESSLEKINTFIDTTTSQDKSLLEEVATLNKEIQTQLTETMKAMRGFIVVLQCEDRISQMLDGIGNIIDHDIQEIESNGLYVPLDKEAPIKASLADFYTIQEQRDFAMGVETTLGTCTDTEEDGFILF